MKIGILPLSRPTFDVEFAQQKLTLMLDRLDRCGHEIAGPRNLLFDEATTEKAIASLKDEAVDQILLLQVTFTDASMAVAAAAAFGQPLSIWAATEPRAGDRLRLNAFCGLNLASHALGLKGRQFSWLFADPARELTTELDALFAGRRRSGRLDPVAADSSPGSEGRRIVETLKGRRLARIGDHPAGFHTCAYSPSRIMELAGVTVDSLELEELFAAAASAPSVATEKAWAIAASSLTDLDNVDQRELNRSLRLKAGLEAIRARGGYDAFAIRCWPETFTEYGGAVCGPAAMMGEAKVPCACEADVYGALTQLVLQEACGSPVFLTDLVDMDVDDNSGVVWHCGQAPISFCDPALAASATVHSNRKMPLLYQFALKPGPVTFLRISQAFNEPKMVLAFGTMLKRPMSFTGTSGVVRFERAADEVLNDIIASGLEHHMALAYGDHRATLRSVAGAMNLPLLEI